MKKHLVWFLVLPLFLLLVACTAETVTVTPEQQTPPTAEPTMPPPPTAEPTAEPEAPDPTEAAPEPEPALEEPTPIAEASPTMETSPTDPVTFELSPNIAASTTFSDVQSTAAQADEGLPYWAILPDHQLYTFEGYALSDTFHDPRLIVYPAPEFADLNPAARDAVTQLQTILAARPALADVETLPFLPIFNAAQVFHAQEAYVDFANGQGIRYLTQFDQAFNPISNRTIFYTFQGLTDDGRHYVTAVLPIASPSLPDDGQLAQDEFEDFVANFDSYLQEIRAGLNETDPNSFTPSLTALDEMMASVAVNLPAPPKRTNDSGQIILTIARPSLNAQLETGAEQVVQGYVAPGTTDPVLLSLLSGPNTLISTTVVPDPTTGDWTTVLPVPNIVNGRGQLIATVGNQQDSVPVGLYAPFAPEGPAPDDVIISLLRPIPGESLPIGMPVFFEGRVQNPLDSAVTIGVLGENCTTFYARQAITLPETGGQWTGVLYLPAEQIPPDDTACAVAYTGTYGENWRETQIRVPLLAPENERAARLTVGLPFSAQFPAGQAVTIFGGALNPPEDVVAVTIQAGDESERVLAKTTAVVDDFGYWTVDVPLPDDYQGFAMLNVTMPGENPDEVFYSTGFTIE